MIPFNKAPVVGNELTYISRAISSGELCGDKNFSRLCELWFEERFSCTKALMTPSCTAALELAALMLDIQPGDEVIVPSYTFVSTANAFVLRGAKIVFVDIRPDTMNIDESKIEAAITSKTKAIVPVHYAGVACQMDVIMNIAERHGLFVVEDAAQGVMSNFNGKALGTIGHLGTFSFHETKNYTSGGEGGLLLINDSSMIERAEIIREKGTNRSKFLQGVVDKYTWVDIGSSYLPSELQSAYLYGQLLEADKINDFRLKVWHRYYDRLNHLCGEHIALPTIPHDVTQNAHMFYIKVKSLSVRTELIKFLKNHGVQSSFHYVPLHSSVAGINYSRFNGIDEFTTEESSKLLRLPLWYGISEAEVDTVVDSIISFFKLY